MEPAVEQALPCKPHCSMAQTVVMELQNDKEALQERRLGHI